MKSELCSRGLLNLRPAPDTCRLQLTYFVVRVPITRWGVSLVLISLSGFAHQRWEDFTLRTPLAPGETLIIGFQGGRDAWNNEKVGVGRMAAKLRKMDLPKTHVETVEH